MLAGGVVLSARGATLTLSFYDTNGAALSFAQVQATQIGTGTGAYAADAFLHPQTLKLIKPTPMTDAGGFTFSIPSGQTVAFAINWPTATQGYGLVILDNGGSGYSSSATINFTYQAAKDTKARLDAAVAARAGFVGSAAFNTAYNTASNQLYTADHSADDAVKGAQGQLALNQLVVAYDLLLKEYGPVYARANHSTTVPWLGFTIEDLSYYTADLDKLAAMAGPYAWVRFVMQPGTTPATYSAAINYAKSKGIKVLGLPVDSSADTGYTRTQYFQRYTNFITSLPAVDVWEVGNEVNGGWSSADIAARVADVAAYCKSQNKKTYLTLFWQINTASPTFAMFNWIATNLPASVRSNLDCVGFSQYQEQAPMGAAFDAVMRRMQVEFPQQQIGIAELGYWIAGQRYWWAYNTNVTTAKHTILDQYYRSALGYAGSHGACFWWNFAAGGSEYDFDAAMTNSIQNLKTELLSTPNPITINCAGDKSVACDSTWDFDAPTATTACSNTNIVLSVISTVTNGSCPKTVTRTWRATDSCQNTNACSQTVTLLDVTPPIIECSSNKTVSAESTWNFDTPVANDDCSGTNVTLSVQSTVTNAGCPQIIIRTWVAVDPCGNSNTCAQTVSLTDNQAPTLAIKSPASSSFTASQLTVTGTAKDNVDLAQVTCQLNGGAIFAASTSNGFSNWTASTQLEPGQNYFNAIATDACGNASTNSRAFFFATNAVFAIVTNGSGSLTASASSYGTPTNGASLQIGRVYTINAVPAPDNLFSNWLAVVNGVTNFASEYPRHRFLMESNLALIANFTTNRFPQIAGTYYGLCADTSSGGVRHESSGAIKLTVKPRTTKPAGFSAQFKLAGDTIGFSGVMNLDGTATNTKPILRKGRDPLIFSVQIPFDGSDTFNGAISCPDEGWSAPFSGFHYTFNSTTNSATNFMGRYTLALPAATNATVNPGGHSFGLVNIKNTGKALLMARLGDGTPAGQAAYLSSDGDWPLYCPINSYSFSYTNNKGVLRNSHRYGGALWGWVSVSPQPAHGLSGDVTWNKTEIPNQILYPDGFHQELHLLGSTYTNIAPMLVLNGGNGLVTFSNGNLALPLQSGVTLSSANTFSSELGGPLQSLRLTPTTGKLSGTFTNTTSGTSTRFYGVVLQTSNQACGYFLGTNQSGAFWLQPE